MKTVLAAAGLSLALAGLASTAASAQDAPVQTLGDRADPQFLGIDLDNGSVYYNGRNSGRYCLYQTVRVFNRYSGYYEYRRARSCGRGLYFR